MADRDGERNPPRASDQTADVDLLGRRRAPAAPADAGLVLAFAPDPGALPAVAMLGDAPLVVGREPPHGGLAIPHGLASRIHARFHRYGGGWVVTDLGSRNGTIVNGRRVGSAAIDDRDEIRVGDAVFLLFVEGASAQAAYPMGRTDPGPLVGGATMAAVAARLRAGARAGMPVLLLGETGTGKEVAARMVHAESGRRGPLCALNCAAIPAPLLESELYGYRRGAFSGADRDKPGLLRAAHGGTLLLDEIGDMAVEAQAKILRVVETGEILPVGATAPEPVDVRIVAATHRDLGRLVGEGRFRGDLLARLRGWVVTVPPLRDRKEDVVPLLRSFLARHGAPSLALGTAAGVALCHHDWPFNVRELESAARHAMAAAAARGAGPGGDIALDDLPDAVVAAMDGYGEPAAQAEPAGAGPRGAAPTAEALCELLGRHGGNVAAVARGLGKDRVQIHRWMRRYGLRADDFRDPGRRENG